MTLGTLPGVVAEETSRQDHPLRLILVDGGDLLYLGIQSIIDDRRLSWKVVHAHNVDELRAIMQIREQTTNPYRDVMVVGAVPSEHFTTQNDLFKTLHTVCPLRMILVGAIRQGWIIDHYVNVPYIRAFLHRWDDLKRQLPLAVIALEDGQRFLSPTAQRYVEESRLTGLTRCKFGTDEVEVLKRLAQGYKVTAIAEDLHLPPRNIYAITNRLRYLFGVNTNEALMIQAQSCGLLRNLPQ